MNACLPAGGEGSTAREVLRHQSVQECVMVDIDEVRVRWCSMLRTCRLHPACQPTCCCTTAGGLLLL